MKLTISHLTHYQYSSEIRLNPHIVRLRPRSTSRQKVLSFSLAVSPDPVHTTVLDSIDDSLCHRLYFIGPSDSLTINTHSVVIAKPSLVPEDLHLYSTAATLPMVYPDVVWQGLSCFLMPIDQSDGVRQLSQSVAESVYFRTDQFLMELTRRIYQSFGKGYRETGWPLAPSETLEWGWGSCRDLAWLYVACCRHFGIAARFVSGYVYDAERCDSGGELHAWAEVYLLGYGWVGYDPTYSCQAGDMHIKLCAGVSPQLCAPVDGTYLGNSTSQLHTDVRISGEPE